MKKIIILSRVSTAQQSLESQTKELINHAKKLGYSESQQIIIEDVESAIKLSEEERMGLQKLKHYINTDKDIDCVICWEPSRLSRQQKTLYSIRDFLVDNKIQLYILNPSMRLLNDDRTQIDSTANIVFSVFSTLAENEMTLKKERFMRAKNELTKQGKKSAGSVIFGYMKDKDKRCVLHPTNSKIIADLFRHYLEDDNTSLYETYQYASQKYPETFPILPYIKAQHKIRHFFDTPVYYEGNWCYPPIISKETWDKTKEKMSNARCKARYQCKKELLSRGKLYCSVCGNMLTPAGGGTRAYTCPTDKEHRLQVNYDAMDWLMWEETRSIVNLNAAMDNNKKIREVEDKIQMKENEVDQINTVVESLKTKENKILDLYIDGKIEKSLLDKRIDEVKKEREIYGANINKINSEINELRIVLEDTQRDLLNTKSVNVDSITNFENRLEYVRKYIDKAYVEKKDNYIYVRFQYKSEIFIVQEGVYKYRNIGGYKHIWRINKDNSEDLIYKVRGKRNEKH